MKKTDDQVLVIFGASGDLAARKLLPALYQLFKGGFLPTNYVILGTSRSQLTDEEFRKKALLESGYLDPGKEDPQQMEAFAEKIFYQPIEGYEADYSPLNDRINELNEKYKTGSNYIFYLSTPPGVYKNIAERLHAVGLSD